MKKDWIEAVRPTDEEILALREKMADEYPSVGAISMFGVVDFVDALFEMAYQKAVDADQVADAERFQYLVDTWPWPDAVNDAIDAGTPTAVRNAIDAARGTQ